MTDSSARLPLRSLWHAIMHTWVLQVAHIEILVFRDQNIHVLRIQFYSQMDVCDCSRALYASIEVFVFTFVAISTNFFWNGEGNRTGEERTCMLTRNYFQHMPIPLSIHSFINCGLGTDYVCRAFTETAHWIWMSDRPEIMYFDIYKRLIRSNVRQLRVDAVEVTSSRVSAFCILSALKSQVLGNKFSVWNFHDFLLYKIYDGKSAGISSIFHSKPTYISGIYKRKLL